MIIRKRIRVTGIVQGVGFRPFILRRAVELGLVGWVLNDSSGVTIEVQGIGEQLDEFLNSFEISLPPLAHIDSMSIVDIAAAPESDFTIHPSAVNRDLSTPISPDISICDDCLRELEDPENRRFGYPFINCTNCGPRFTIMEDIPYDRPLTTMKSFPMCDACRMEYDDPGDRRFHAQPIACPECGPSVWWMPNGAGDVDFKSRNPVANHTAIIKFGKALQQGQIIAVKGIGGFHLACDATNEAAIAKLRERKGRIDRPFAVMVRDVVQVRTIAQVNERERKLLESKERPIVLLSKKQTSDLGIEKLHHSVAPGIDFIGVMLPYSPLHYLLIGSSPVVFTSGNITDEPIVRTNDEAKARLAGIADSYLLHDRKINVVCDDSVVRCVDAQLMPIRRSRGYAPMPVKLLDTGPSILAVGGEIKSTFCLTRDNYAYLSQHIGDMGNLETLEAMQRSVEHFRQMFRVRVDAIAADLHPGYLSGNWAAEFANLIGVPLIRVQHHFAHVAALIAEHQIPTEQQIIGCCFDGTGYGLDGAIWGGEFQIANGHSFQRFGHLAYTPLPGGDASIKRPYRIALAQLWASGMAWQPHLPCVGVCPESERKLLQQQLNRNVNCVSTSSMGRLFDVVASLIGVRQTISYEGQAAMELESLAGRVAQQVDREAYQFLISRTSPIEFDPRELIRQICIDLECGVDQSTMAAQFHHAVANMLVAVCNTARDETSINTVGLTGGVFQNLLLLRLSRAQLVAAGFNVLTHAVVPPNDGGIALGQALAARIRLTDGNFAGNQL